MIKETIEILKINIEQCNGISKPIYFVDRVFVDVDGKVLKLNMRSFENENEAIKFKNNYLNNAKGIDV